MTLIRTILIGVVVFTTSIVNAQFNINTNPYWQGKITLTDGTIKEGYVQVPNSSSQKKVSFKNSQKSKDEAIQRKMIASVNVISPNGKEYLYECLPVVRTITGKSSIGKNILLVMNKNDYATFYIVHGVYKVNEKEGEIELLYRFQYGKDFPVTEHYIRKRGAEKANLLTMTGHLGGLKKGAEHHLTEDKALLAKIKSGELKIENIAEIVDTYLKTTEEM